MTAEMKAVMLGALAAALGVYLVRYIDNRRLHTTMMQAY